MCTLQLRLCWNTFCYCLGEGGESKSYINIFITNCNKSRKNTYTLNKDKKEPLGNPYLYQKQIFISTRSSYIFYFSYIIRMT